MVRSILVGLLAISAISACKGGGSDAPAVQPGATAGKVVELTGTVTATRAGATRTLDAHSEISGDDVIETAADARVTIVLAHNNATWALGPGKKSKVSESAAWTLAKVDKPATSVDETSTAAGRHAEREAAHSDSESAPAPQAAMGGSRGSGAMAPMAPPVAQPVPVQEPKTERARDESPPPPPAKAATKGKMQPRDEIDDLLQGDGEAQRKSPAPGGGGVPPQSSDVAVKELTEALKREAPAIRTCVTAAGSDKVAVKFHSVNRKVTVMLADGKPAGACFDKLAARIKLTVDLPQDVTVSFKK